MTRDIKFRAWTDNLKDGGAMYYQRLTDYLTPVFSPAGYGLFNPTLKIMQFTGLLDKNGKEIFENDIIKIKCHGDIIIGDVFYNQSRCCYMVNHPAGYNGCFALHTPTIEICDEFNIIGNIYQNPELLKGENE
jgi:hypothetical protein